MLNANAQGFKLPQKVTLIYAISLIVAFCSMCYELILAHCLTITLGNSIIRYTSTIGFFLFFLGMGSLAAGKINKSNHCVYLLKIEIALSFLGLLAPCAILIQDNVSIHILKFFPQLEMKVTGEILNWLGMHFWIFLIGFLSGFEIPILMELAATIKKDERSAQMVLGFDYIGMFLASVAYPLLIFQYLGLIYASALTALLNAICAAFLIPLATKQRLLKIATCTILTLCLLIILNEEWIRFFLSNLLSETVYD